MTVRLRNLCFVALFTGGSALAAVPPDWAALLARGDGAACKAALDGWLGAQEKAVASLDPGARWQRLRQTPGYLHALAQAELLRVTGADSFTRVLASPRGRDFLAAFMADREWLTTYLASGPVPENTPDGLACLRDICLADRDPDAPKYRKLATAVALVFNTEPLKHRLLEVTSRDKNPLTPAARYAFFKESQRAGRLRPLFADLAVWELRWVVCAPVENEALEWLQKNVNLPVDQFVDACWIPRYRGVNDFGDTIQGPLFYAPSRPHSNWAEDIARHGGVCGSLSTFGAFNAMAHGLPAMPKGQPGHCAYTFRVAPGKWVPGFGGPDGGAAYHFWKDSFSYVWLADDAFTDSGHMRSSMQLAWQARRTSARETFALAVAEQPLNWPVWQEYIAAALADQSMSKFGWQELADSLVKGMGKHPQPMCELLSQFEEKALWPALSADEKLAFFLKVHDTVAANERPGWTPWNMPDALLPRQLKALGGSDTAGVVFGRVLAAYCRHSHDYFVGQLIEWGAEHLAKTPGGQEPFFAAINAALGGAEKLDDKLRENVLNNAIRATEEARSLAGFQSLSAAAAAYATAEGSLKLDTPEGGKLVSADGLLYLSGSDGWDRPVSHRGVLSESGGFFHCQPAKGDKDERRWAVVQLRESCTLTGLLLVNRLSNQGRCKALRIFASADEKTWVPVAETGQFGQQWKVDLRGKNIRARWVKVENVTPKTDAFHLRNICVYGEAPK